MSTQVAVITNVLDYAGPPAAAALSAAGIIALCHSENFASADERASFEATHPGRTAAVAQTPEDLVTEAIDRFGRIDTAISNDAGDIKNGPFVDRSVDDFRALLEAFSVRPARLALAAASHMTGQGGGRILFVTSGAPLNASAGMSMYSSARAAANALVRSLARELGPAQISVNAVAPFYLESNYLPQGMADPVVAERVRSAIPLHRLGRPDEVGHLVALLVSGKVDFVSGQVIAFSGGGA